MRKSILVVDDDLFIRDIASHVLGVDNNVLLAHDMINARNILHNEHIDLILLDIKLEKETSESLFKIIHHKKEKEIPVIVFSSNQDPGIKDNYIDMGIADYIQKPFNLNDLEVRIKDVLIMDSPPKMQKKKKASHFKNWFLRLIKIKRYNKDEVC
ncbi:response regulator [Flammeovirga aprica]|uniref:Response regulator n=1 Tax=Flammeovirga aprica JL-4 TaxID=694437 RepID=A0A7X9RRM0_9BACT|nr:response regulator [Flammeovirga aprica]NME68028.1 response regulator [Flammeovirga aprica JL-4]